MATQPATVIVVPTYNEKDNLAPLVTEVLATLPEAHVLVVDDRSPDGTGELAESLARGDQRIHVSHGPGKQGLARAYAQGFRWALAHGYELIFEMDCDFSHQPKHLPQFVAAARDADLVLGSRYAPGGGTVNWKLSRRLVSQAGNFYARSVLGLARYRDLTGGFKCFRRAVLEAVDFEHLLCTGYGFQVELTFRAHKLGFRIVEVPIMFPDRKVGQSKMSGAIVKEALLTLPRLRFRPLQRPQGR